MNQLGADAAAVLLYDAGHQELTFAAGLPLEPHQEGHRPLRTAPCRHVIARRKNIIIADLERAGGRYPSPERYSFKDAFKDSSMPRLITLESGSTFGLTEAACT